MSLIVSVYTREGIVMAADSRLTLTYPRTIPGEAPHTFSVAASDNAKKLFLTPNRVASSGDRILNYLKCRVDTRY